MWCVTLQGFVASRDCDMACTILVCYKRSFFCFDDCLAGLGGPTVFWRQLIVVA